MIDWASIVARVNRWFPRAWKRSPWLTSGFHALMTVLGLVPYPFGMAGVVFWLTGNGPWVWLASSTWSLVWYWVREWRQNRLRPKPKHPPNTTWTQGAEPPGLTFWQRWDPWLDVLVPTAAHGGQWWVLLAVL